MSDTAEIKHRIKSVSDTHQITKAMELISVSKMRKAMEKQAVNAAYFNSVRSTIKDIMRHSTDIRHKYLVHRPNDRTAYIVIAGDKGLAGAFNSNVLNMAWEHMQTRPVHYVVTIGQMARAFFENKHQPVDLEFTHAVTNPTLHDARGIMRDILDLYDRNLMDEVIVAGDGAPTSHRRIRYPRRGNFLLHRRNTLRSFFEGSIERSRAAVSRRHDLFGAYPFFCERTCFAHVGDV